MEYKFVMITSMFFLVFTYGNAQKTQTKAAEMEYQKRNFPAALKIINTSEYLIFNATDEEKSDFFFLKGNVLKSLANENIEMAKNLTLAVGAYQELIGFERESGKIKHSIQAQTIIKDIKFLLLNSAAADFKASLFNESAVKSYTVYLIDKKDTLNLFYAASSSMSAKDYDSAIKYYVELKKINYSGKGIIFSATNKKTKVEENFVSASSRDANVKSGLFEKPKNEDSPSKRVEINKNLAYLYLVKGDVSNAESCYIKVLDIDPNYVDAYINIAYLRLEGKKNLVDEMNNLGNTPKEMKLYDQLKIKKDNLVKSVIPYLKKAVQIEPKNTDIIKSLLGVYRSLDMMSEYNDLKVKM